MINKPLRSATLFLCLIFGLKTFRNFGYGLFSCIFFQALFYKGFIESDILTIQFFSLLGMIIFSLLWSKVPKFVSINTLWYSYALKLISALIYMYNDSLALIAISGLLGFLPVTGKENTFFMMTEQTLLNNIQVKFCKNVGKTNKYKIYLNTLKYVGQAFGCFFAGYYVSKHISMCSKFSPVLFDLVRIYCYVCAIEVILCLVLKIMIPFITVIQSSAVPAKRLQFSYFSLIRGFSEASLINTFLIYFLSEHYLTIQYMKICYILAGKCLLQAFTPLFLKLSLIIFRRKLTICLNYLSHILLFLMMSHHVYFRSQPAAAYVLTFVVLRKFDLHQQQFNSSADLSQQMKQHHPQKHDNVMNSRLEQVSFKDIGMTMGLAFNYLFISQPSFSKLFFQPFINLSILSILLKVYAYYQLSRLNQLKKGQTLPNETDFESESMINNQIQNQ